jgi:predicted MPP superfamily phosphohydrolase
LSRLAIFILVFLSIYGGVHIYGFVKLKRGLALETGTTIALALFMAAMVVAPIATRVTERLGFEVIARIFAHIGYVWMGGVFIFISAAFVFDIYRMLLFLVSSILRTDLAWMTLSVRQSCLISILLAFSIVIYGAFEALQIRTEHVTIRTAKLPLTVERLRIVQISDIHLGLIVGKNRLGRILRQVVKANPDILVSTGDLVDGQMDNLSELAAMFQDVSPPYGKLAVTGNHEFYAGLERSFAFTEKAGFFILRGEVRTIANMINIVGVDDPARGPYGPGNTVSEKDLLSNLPRDKFTLLLKHRPRVEEEALGRFDLQLSGHTHKGQIFPFSLITNLTYQTHAGLAELKDNSMLYVSRGSGTWGPPMRFLAAPEVTVIDLVRAK